MRMRVGRWVGAVGLATWWATLQLASRVKAGEPLTAQAIVLAAAVGLAFGGGAMAANAWGERRVGGYNRLADADRASVDAALRSGVPDDDPRLRAVERERAQRLASPGLLLAILLWAAVVAAAAWTVRGWGAWPVGLRATAVVWFVCMAATLVLDVLRDRRPLRALLAATR